MLKTLRRLVGCCLALAFIGRAAAEEPVCKLVDEVIPPLMQREDIPGMAVAVVVDGSIYLCNYGVSSRDARTPVTADTLFEIGSVSKTFTAALATYAQEEGKISFDAPVSRYLPELRGSRFDAINLIHLATHTAGGLPLQVPGEITTRAELFDYLRRWQPTDAPGTRRVYSNVSIGLLGVLTAEALGQPFEDAVQKSLLPELGLHHTYFHVPAEQAAHYAQGYTTDDRPVRVSPGMLDAEAYGLKSCSADLGSFLLDQMADSAGAAHISNAAWRALAATRTGYYTAGELTQDLIWEQYPYPVELSRLLAGNADAMITGAVPAVPLRDPLPPQAEGWVNKTGSTNGFSTYLAFVPGRHLGVVLLANKRYAIAARVTAAYEILTRVDHLPRPR